MPKPEISRRCRSCGVSLRVRASFCPQCGKALTPKSVKTSEAEDTTPLTPDSGTPDLITDTPQLAATKPLKSGKKGVPPSAFSTPPSGQRNQPKQATVGMVYRGEPRPRKLVEEDEPNRVEKFRQLSSAMIDEASYDPSLRFVLVAAVLFILFLFLLLLSELIT